jgi:glycosyltransferase involved in cell wall biosynthesis
MKGAYPSPTKARLSVVIPVFNAEQWMGPTLERLGTALSKSNWKHVEIIVVDDGSTDKTAEAVTKVDIGFKVRVISQENQGRFIARRTGIDASSGDFIFFIDSRVFAYPNSFKSLEKQMLKHPDAIVWNGHVEIERIGNPYARFWYCVTYLAWRRYLANPRLVHYSYADFDYYPKGTTCFLVPRKLIVDAYEQFSTDYSDLGNANDDSSLIRYIAKQTDIYLTPEFAFIYHSRNTFRSFIKHTAHRGVVFIDGFLHKGTRYYYPLIAYLLLLPVGVAGLIIFPQLLLALPFVLVGVFAVVKLLGPSVKDAVSFTIILPLFVICYSKGLYTGLLLRRAAKD